MRFTAPIHTTAIALSTGPLAVIDGVVETPGMPSDGDRSGLAANGFLPAPAAEAPPADFEPVAPEPVPPAPPELAPVVEQQPEA